MTQATLEAFLSRARQRGSAWADAHGRWGRLGYELIAFAVKQAWACLFGATLLALLIGTHFLYPRDAALSRYDFLVIASVTIQVLLIASGMETKREAAVILIFHAVGTVMEVFKTHVGSWEYPEPSVLRIGGVPLFSGFMYAAVGSYLARVWRLFDFRFRGYPERRWTVVLAALVYGNFFFHHVGPDLRWFLIGGIALLYGRTWVEFRVDREHRSMPLCLGFALVSLFIWLAENLSTLAAAWRYPYQRHAWHPVGIDKLGSWFLLMNISFVLITLVHRPRDAVATPLSRPRQPST